MKLILARDGIKREIDGPFEMLASRADATRLHNILTELLREDQSHPFNYGWFRVDDGVDSPSNTLPRKWTE